MNPEESQSASEIAVRIARKVFARCGVTSTTVHGAHTEEVQCLACEKILTCPPNFHVTNYDIIRPGVIPQWMLESRFKRVTPIGGADPYWKHKCLCLPVDTIAYDVARALTIFGTAIPTNEPFRGNWTRMRLSGDLCSVVLPVHDVNKWSFAVTDESMCSVGTGLTALGQCLHIIPLEGAQREQPGPAMTPLTRRLTRMEMLEL